MNQELISNYANAVATLLTGGFAFWVYKKSQIDKKREAAKLVLLEIHKIDLFRKRTAQIFLPIESDPLLFQQKIFNYATTFSNDSLYPLEISGWSNSKHILSPQFTLDEIAKIEEFDVVMKKYSSDFSRLGKSLQDAAAIKSRCMQEKLIEISSTVNGDKQKYNEIKKNLITVAESDPEYRIPADVIDGVKSFLTYSGLDVPLRAKIESMTHSFFYRVFKAARL